MSGLGAGSKVNSYDASNYANMIDLQSKVDLVKVEVNSLRTEQFYFQQNLLKQLKEQVDLTGCTQFYSAGSDITIAAGTNVNGVEIPICSWTFYSTNVAALLIGGTQVTPYNATSDVECGTIHNVFVPAGVEVKFFSNNAGVPVSGAYKIL